MSEIVRRYSWVVLVAACVGGCGKGTAETAGAADDTADDTADTETDAVAEVELERYPGPQATPFSWLGGSATPGLILAGYPLSNVGFGTAYLLETASSPEDGPESAWLETAAVATIYGTSEWDALGREGVAFGDASRVVVLRGQTAEGNHQLWLFEDPVGEVLKRDRSAEFVADGFLETVGIPGVADVDADGADDVLVPILGIKEAHLCWFPSSVKGVLTRDDSESCLDGAFYMVTEPRGDLDGDGHLDVAGYHLVDGLTTVDWIPASALLGGTTVADSSIATAVGPYTGWGPILELVHTQERTFVAWTADGGYGETSASWLVGVEPGGVVDVTEGVPLHAGATTTDDLIAAAYVRDGGFDVVTFEGTSEEGGDLAIDSFDDEGHPAKLVRSVEVEAPGLYALGALDAGVLGIANRELIWIPGP